MGVCTEMCIEYVDEYIERFSLDAQTQYDSLSQLDRLYLDEVIGC